MLKTIEERKAIRDTILNAGERRERDNLRTTEYMQSAKLYLKSSELGFSQPLTRRVLGVGAHLLAREGLGES